jgi:hypothetical protein
MDRCVSRDENHAYLSTPPHSRGVISPPVVPLRQAERGHDFVTRHTAPPSRGLGVKRYDLPWPRKVRRSRPPIPSITAMPPRPKPRPKRDQGLRPQQ